MYLSLGFRADVKFMIRGNDLWKTPLFNKDPAPSSTTDIVLRFQRNVVAESPVCTNDLYPPLSHVWQKAHEDGNYISGQSRKFSNFWVTKTSRQIFSERGSSRNLKFRK